MKTQQSIRLFAIVIMLLQLVLLGLPAQAAGMSPASSYTVNTTAETGDANLADDTCADVSGMCSLRAAVEQANAHAGEDTIILPGWIFYLTMRLEPVDDLIIDGAGRNSTIIDGAGSSGAEGFRIRANVQFKELTLRDFPRAIYISSTESNHQVTIADSTLRDNTNTDNTYSGSAIVNYCSTCTVSLSNVDVSYNASPYCGAIANKGTLNLSNNTLVHGNQATSTYGGGICNTNGTLNVEFSRIYGNQTPGNPDSDYGGGIFQSGGSVSLFLSEVYGNSAYFGGGIYISNSGSFSALNAQIYSNSAIGSAGGILISGGGPVMIDSSIIRENTAVYAGGVYAWSSVTVKNSTIISNTASSMGGGIWVNDQTTTLINTTISGNRAGGNGGGIYTTNSAVARLANVSVVKNTANSDASGDDYGGGVFQNSSSVIRIKNSVIAGNIDVKGPTIDFYAPDCYGDLTSDGYNLVGRANAWCSLIGDMIGVQYGSPITLDPKLGPLTFYALEYYYHPVLFGPLVDSGNPAGCKDYANVAITSDQLGNIRPYGSASSGYIPRCDLGAVESFLKSFRNYVPIIVR